MPSLVYVGIFKTQSRGRQHILKEKGCMMDYLNLVPVTGVIVSITRGEDCCSQMLTLHTSGGIVNFIMDGETIVLENRQLRAGMRIAAFYDSTLAVPLIFPPQYRAAVVTSIGRSQQVMLTYFDSSLLSQDGNLQLNVGRNTMIRTANGQSYSCSVGDHILLVYYTATTRSMPPQTTPEKIVVFC